MKKRVFYFIAIFLVLFSLNTTAQIKIGAKAGLNLANAAVEGLKDTKSKIGIHIGGIAELEIADALSAQVGLLLSQKGYKVEESGTDFGISYSSEEKASLFYLDIPLTAMYKYELSDFSIYGKGGFNIGMGLSGKYSWEDTYDGDTDSGDDSIEWGSGVDDHLKRLELGFILGAGVEFNENIQVGLSYNIGLNDISAQDGSEIKNRVFAITVSYFLTDF